MTVAGNLIIALVILKGLNNVGGQLTESTGQLNSSSRGKAERLTALCPNGWIPATVPRPGYDLVRNQLCVRLSGPDRPWANALSQCRMARGFLVKLDSVMMLQDMSLFDYLRQKDVNTIWSGMHHKYGTLLWDDLHPKVVKVFIGENEPFGWRKRGYSFNQTSYSLGDKTCGYLTLARNQTSRPEQLDKRLKRATLNRNDRSTLEPMTSGKDQHVKQGNSHSDSDDGPSKSVQSDNLLVSRKLISQMVTLKPPPAEATTQTTTTDQSDLEDSDHPGPTTLHPPVAEVTSTVPKVPKEQSAKGTSLPASTPFLTTTADSQGIQNLDDFLYNPSSDTSLDSSPNTDLTALEELHGNKKPEMAFDSLSPKAVQMNSALLQPVALDKNDSKSLLLSKLEPLKASETSAATASSLEPATLMSTTTEQTLHQNTTEKAVSTMKIPLANSTRSALHINGLGAMMNQNFMGLTDPENSKENSDSASSESRTTTMFPMFPMNVAPLALNHSNTVPFLKIDTLSTTTASALSPTPTSTGTSSTYSNTSNSTSKSVHAIESSAAAPAQTTESIKAQTEISQSTTPTQTSQSTATPVQTMESTTTPAQTLESTTTPAQTLESTTTPAQTLESTTTPAQTLESTTTPAQTLKSTTSPAQTSEWTTTPAQISQSTTTLAQTSQSTTVPAQILESTTTPAQTSQSTTTIAQTMESTTTPAQISKSTTTAAQTSQSTTTPAQKLELTTVLAQTTPSTPSPLKTQNPTKTANALDLTTMLSPTLVSTTTQPLPAELKTTPIVATPTQGSTTSDSSSSSSSLPSSTESTHSTPTTTQLSTLNTSTTLTQTPRKTNQNDTNSSSSNEMSASSESKESSSEQVTTMDDDIFPAQPNFKWSQPTSTPSSKENLPSVSGSKAGDSEAAQKSTSKLDPQLATADRDFLTAIKVVPPTPPVDVVSLGNCNEERASVCFTEAIEQLSLVNHCEINWYGHRLLDRCYKPHPSTGTEAEARQLCLRLNATLVKGDTDFYGNLTAILHDMLVAVKMTGKRVWLDTSQNKDITSVRGLCSALENGQIIKVSCNTKLSFLCQKDAQWLRTLEDYRDNLEAITYIQNMTSFQPQTLPCPLAMTAFDETIVWFKDGRPIDDLTDEEISAFGPKNGQLPNSLVLDINILKRVGETNPMFLKAAMLQGEYWCEIWRKEPFHRVPSNKIYLKFTDVITLRGVIFTEPISYTDAAIFNRMGQKVGVPAAMELRLNAMNKEILVYLRSILPIVRDVITSIKNVNALDGRSEFVTYICTSTGDLQPHLRGHVVDNYLSAFFESLVVNEDIIRSEWNLSLPLIRAVSVSMTDLCPAKVLVDRKTNFSAEFPSTPVNTQAMSRDYCNGTYSGFAYCKGNQQSGADWDSWSITQSCLLHNASAPVPGSVLNGGANKNPAGNPTSTKMPNVIAVPDSDFLDQQEKVPAPDDVSHLSDLLSQMLNQTSNMTQSDIHTVAHLVNSVASVNKPPREVGEMLIQTVNKVLDASPEVLIKAEEDTHAPSRMLEDLEQFGNKVDMQGQDRIRFVAPNLAMELWNLQNYNDLVIGFGAVQADNWSMPLEEPRIVTIKNRTWLEKNLSGFDVAIELPESLVRDQIKYSQRDLDKAIRLTMFMYRKTSAFLPPNVGETPSGEINSAIISASLGEHRVEGLEEKVRIVFKPFKESKNDGDETKCVFWDTRSYANPTWSTTGCTYNGTLNDRHVCLCDHLTNFAILLDFYGDDKSVPSANETSLSVLTLIGLSLSIFGLAITIITFLAFKKLRQGRAQQTLFNMAVALLCFQTTFLVGVKQTSYKSVCLTVSALLHYFILVSFAWMLIEAVLQYLTFVKVLGTYISKYTLKTVVSAWGFPLIPVIAVLATDYNLYIGRANYCWMNLYAFYYAFALPVGIIIVFNSVMFFIIIVSLLTRPKGLRSNQSSNKARETNLKAAFTIFILLGLTWLFGYFAIEDARAVFQYAFTILSSMQGFLIFILMVVRRKQVRDLWSAACCDRRQALKSNQKKHLSPSSSNSMSSNNSLSNSNRTLPSFINHAYAGGSLVLKPGIRRENSVSI